MNNASSFVSLPVSWSLWSYIVYVGQVICLCLVLWSVLRSLIQEKPKQFSECCMPLVLIGLVAFLFGVVDCLYVLIYGVRPVLCSQVNPAVQDIGIALLGALFPVLTGAILFTVSVVLGLALYIVKRPQAANGW